jgi:hypothetical protein
LTINGPCASPSQSVTHGSVMDSRPITVRHGASRSVTVPHTVSHGPSHGQSRSFAHRPIARRTRAPTRSATGRHARPVKRTAWRTYGPGPTAARARRPGGAARSRETRACAATHRLSEQAVAADARPSAPPRPLTPLKGFGSAKPLRLLLPFIRGGAAKPSGSLPPSSSESGGRPAPPKPRVRDGRVVRAAVGTRAEAGRHPPGPARAMAGVPPVPTPRPPSNQCTSGVCNS